MPGTEVENKPLVSNNLSLNLTNSGNTIKKSIGEDILNNRVLCESRDSENKGKNHRLRVQGKVPGVIYGLNKANMNVEFGRLDIFHVLEDIGEHGVVELDRAGTIEKAIIKEVQRHPITKEITHIDLQRIDENKKIHTHVPILILGEETLRKKDIMVQNQINEVEIECNPVNLPNHFTIDASGMVPGRRITFNDLEISSEISIIGNPDTIIASITKVKHNAQNVEEPNEDSIIL